MNLFPRKESGDAQQPTEKKALENLPVGMKATIEEEATNVRYDNAMIISANINQHCYFGYTDDNGKYEVIRTSPVEEILEMSDGSIRIRTGGKRTGEKSIYIVRQFIEKDVPGEVIDRARGNIDWALRGKKTLDITST